MCILTSLQICFEPESQEESEAFPMIFVGSSCMFPWERTYLPVQTFHFYLCPQLCSLGYFHLFYGAYSHKSLEHSLFFFHN